MFEQLGNLLGGGASEGFGAVISDVLAQQGGVAGLVEKFQQGGLGELAQSWVGTGGNLPISAEQIQSVLGSDAVTQIAGKLGIDPQQASNLVAQHLPGIVDQLTPNGELPQGGDVLSQGLGALGKLFS
ncbi:YidB family protein [Chitinolyticbacter albus]|uniref:YidB family protein n=1 Tax=Chitinolyticbacter albus TaxID=2961951 RepID=UPI00210A0748|nr:YidB family protein [Chitinolyticbacter albus]